MRGRCEYDGRPLFLDGVQEGEVVQVIPINRLSVLWVIVFSWLFLKKQESVTTRIVIGGVLAVVGAFAIAWGSEEDIARRPRGRLYSSTHFEARGVPPPRTMPASESTQSA